MAKLSKQSEEQRPRVVAGLCVTEHGLALMGKRRDTALRPELWELPGGKVNPGEDPMTALRREWREEIRVEIEVMDLVHVAPIDLDTSFDLMLYRVFMLSSSAAPTAIVHSRLTWVAPEHAVRHMPCSPGFYAQYRAIAGAVRR